MRIRHSFASFRGSGPYHAPVVVWPVQPNNPRTKTIPARAVRQNRSMPLTIPVAHDFVCPWCWVALIQTRKLTAEFDVTFDWIGYELWPEVLEFPEPNAPTPAIPNKPKIPSRLEFLLHLEEMEIPVIERPKRIRTTKAHLAVEFAKTIGKAEEINAALYEAFWLRGEHIGELDVILEIAKPILGDVSELRASIEERRYFENLVGFDDPAYEKGVYNVPTYWIGDERYAEQPTLVLRKAILAAQSGA